MNVVSLSALCTLECASSLNQSCFKICFVERLRLVCLMTLGENAPVLLHIMLMMQVPVCCASQINSLLGGEAPFSRSVSMVSTCPLYVHFLSEMKPVVQNVFTNFCFVFGMVHQENFH